MIAYPEIIVSPDFPTIRFKNPRDKINLDVELPRIIHAQGWGCGTYFHVQFLNHEKTRLLASAIYVVNQEVEGIQTSDHPYQPMTKTVYSRTAVLIGNWWENPDDNENKVATKTVSWNPGRKMHQVKIGGKVVYETPDKEEARKISDGEMPVPAAA